MKIHGAVLKTIGATRPYSASKPITVSELELDAPGPDEVLVRIEAAGVCHSDLSVVDGNRVRPVPMLLGHEAAGVVEELGAGVNEVEVGDRVVMSFLPRCGHCAACATNGVRPCTEGGESNEAGELLGGARRLDCHGETVNHHLGVSGFATQAVVHRSSATKVGTDVPPEVAAVLGCAVLTGGGAVINTGKPQTGDTVAVVGLGGVGMAALITSLAHAGVTVVGVDGVASKLELAGRLGAHETYTPAQALEHGVKADLVIEAAGNAKAFETAVELTTPGGHTVTVGLPAPDARSSISPLQLVAQSKSITGSYLGSALPSRDIPKFAQWWREGRLPVEELISSHIGLESINEAMDSLADGAAVRQIITF